jgi:hypothetical protein
MLKLLNLPNSIFQQFVVDSIQAMIINIINSIRSINHTCFIEFANLVHSVAVSPARGPAAKISQKSLDDEATTDFFSGEVGAANGRESVALFFSCFYIIYRVRISHER